MKYQRYKKNNLQNLFIVLLSILTLALINLFPFNSHYPITDMSECRLIKVIDGDTLKVDINGIEETVRLVEIDTPESVNPDESKNTYEGVLASKNVSSILKKNQILYISKDMTDRDKYGRLLRVVWIEKPLSDSPEEFINKSLNAHLVQMGYAKVVKYDDYKYHKILKSLENEYRRNK